ncbi:MAG: amino acid adenylation domain-containing protein [Cyclobacteriaceae bacterium]
MKKVDKVRFTAARYRPYISHWSQYLPDFYEGFSFRQYHSTQAQQAKSLVEVPIVLSEESKAVLQNLSGLKPTPLLTILGTAWAILISRYSGLKHITIHTPMFQGVTEEPLFQAAVPLMLSLDGKLSVKEALIQGKETIAGAYKHQNFPTEMVTNEPEAFTSNTSFVFTPLHENILPENTEFGLVANLSGEVLHLTISYDSRFFDPAFVERSAGHYNNILTGLSSLETPISTLTVMGEDERNLLLHDLNNTAKDYSSRFLIPELFDRQVAHNSEDSALVCGDRAISYSGLQAEANRMARYISKHYGVGPGDRVAVLLPRSEQLIISLIGILKAGAAFLPIDYSYPPELISYILENAESKLLITTSDKSVQADCPTLFPDNSAIALEESEAYDCPAKAGDTAYVIYTSGSTGRPKGVELLHSNFYNYIYWANEYYFDWKKHHHFPLFTSISFDLTITCIFTTLLRGDRLYIFEEGRSMPDVLEDIFRPETEITAVKLTPSHISLLAHSSLERTNVNSIITGGEALVPAQVTLLKNLNPLIRIYNEYAPTETTVGCTIKLVRDEQDITIGTPIANTKIYLLHNGSDMVPYGMTGEIVVGSAGVAKGYWKKPDLTAERFISSPFGTEEKLYRTGDIGRWLPNGEIEYLGRADSQIKIRGNRVELHEVSFVMQEHADVKEAIVCTHKESEGAVSLAGFYTATEPLHKNEFRRYLLERLPDYKAPTYLMQVEAFPLTPNGKTDTKVLIHMLFDCSTSGTAPSNEKEKVLADVWKAVLNRQNICIFEDFYTIGGDSIRAMQVSSALYQKGWHIQVKEVLRNPTISQLAVLMTPVSSVENTEAVEGKVPLTPIQREFFTMGRKFEDYFNFAIMFRIDATLSDTCIQVVFGKVVEHHDALRMVFTKEDGNIIQYNQATHGEVPLEAEDLCGTSEPARVLEERATAMQQSLSLANGPLLKLGRYHLPDGDRLLIVVHHLVMDVMSWRILFEDIQTLLDQYHAGQELRLPSKTTSFKTWAETLCRVANNPDFVSSQSAYWQEALSKAHDAIMRDHDITEETYIKDTEKYVVSLSATETDTLLYQASRHWQAEVNEILISALAAALQETFDLQHVAIALEGHGREEVTDTINLTRTVGYFTSTYPVILSPDRYNPETAIAHVKEQLRAIPVKGLGYGMLRYLTDSQPLEKHVLQPAVCYNFFGQFDQETGNLSLPFAEESSGPTQHPDEVRLGYDFYITALIENSKLTLRIEFSQKQYQPATVTRLAEEFISRLQRVLSLSENNLAITPNSF